MNRIKIYYQLAKPGIIYGNVLVGVAGFFIAAEGKINPSLLVSFMIGLALVIASACVLNNIIDRNIDRKMARTKKRALATGEVSVKAATVYSIVLGGVGFLLLAVYVNWLVVWLGAAAYIMYVAVYGAAKRTTVHGTLVGSIPGALPPVAGYAAATGYLDEIALLLFIILVAWQMPHFYAIGMFRQKEYKAASIPVLPVVKGVQIAKQHIVVYILSFIVAAEMLTILGRTGIIYATAMAILGGVWLYRALQGFKTANDEKWARGLFGFSLVVLLGFSITTILDAWLI